MIDRTELPEASSPAAPRRAFRSKVDTIRPTYGFEDVSLAPGTDTIEPTDVDLAQAFCGIELAIPILASAMDAVMDARMAGELGRLGGLAFLNLEGVQARFDDPDVILEKIATASDDQVHDLLAEAYQQPIREELIAARIEAIHAAGSRAAVAATPGAARRFGPFAAEQGADLFLVQSQVSSARHIATEYDPLSLAEFTTYMPIPVAVGNTTNAEAAFALMEQGAAAVFVGVGPGAACTTREVLGIGVPQVTAISDVAAARDAYHTETGRYVPVVADGGMRRGGELAKAIADRSLGSGSIAGDEYLYDMQMARVDAKGEAHWVETCFCDPPLEEERPYWEKYFDLLSVKNAHSRRNCRHENGTEPWACCDCDCTKRLEERLTQTGKSFLQKLQSLEPRSSAATRVRERASKHLAKASAS